MLVVDGGVEAEIVFDPFTFFIGAGDANYAAAVDLAELADDAAGGASGGGDDEGFAGLGFAYFEEAEIGGEAVDAEEIQKIGVGEEGDAGKFLESALSLAGENDIFLEAGQAGDFVSLFEIRIAGFDDFGKAEGAHDFADLHGWHVLGEVGHPDAHGGVDGEIFNFGEGLALGDSGNRG